MASQRKGDDFPGSTVVGDRVGDERVDAKQERKGPDYSSFQTTSGAADLSSARSSANQENFEVKDGYATASVNPLDRGDNHTLKSK